ncbi:unnamed protein product, partial [Candidula unifasciata]
MRGYLHSAPTPTPAPPFRNACIKQGPGIATPGELYPSENNELPERSAPWIQRNQQDWA